MITAANGLAEAVLHYLPYGDFSGWNGTPLNPPAFAGMDEEYYNGADSGTDHAQFRQYYDWQGRWMSPDPYSGSYDFSNPQSLNRYTYAMNNPNVFTDPSGLLTLPEPPPINPCDYVNCLSGISGPLNPTAVLGPTGPGVPTSSSFISHVRPGGAGGSSGIYGTYTLRVTVTATSGESVATADLFCTTFPTSCTLGVDAVQVVKRIPAAAATLMLWSMEGDKAAAPDRCQKIISAAQAACVEELYGGNSNGHGQSGPSLFRKCVRQKIAGSGCSY